MKILVSGLEKEWTEGAWKIPDYANIKNKQDHEI